MEFEGKLMKSGIVIGWENRKFMKLFDAMDVSWGMLREEKTRICELRVIIEG